MLTKFALRVKNSSRGLTSKNFILVIHIFKNETVCEEKLSSSLFSSFSFKKHVYIQLWFTLIP